MIWLPVKKEAVGLSRLQPLWPMERRRLKTYTRTHYRSAGQLFFSLLQSFQNSSPTHSTEKCAVSISVETAPGAGSLPRNSLYRCKSTSCYTLLALLSLSLLNSFRDVSFLSFRSLEMYRNTDHFFYITMKSSKRFERIAV